MVPEQWNPGGREDREGYGVIGGAALRLAVAVAAGMTAAAAVIFGMVVLPTLMRPAAAVEGASAALFVRVGIGWCGGFVLGGAVARAVAGTQVRRGWAGMLCALALFALLFAVPGDDTYEYDPARGWYRVKPPVTKRQHLHTAEVAGMLFSLSVSAGLAVLGDLWVVRLERKRAELARQQGS